MRSNPGEQLTRPMQLDDEAQVLGLNLAAIPHVARLDPSEFRRLHSLSSSHLVTEYHGKLLGYALVFAAGDSYDGEEFQVFKAELPEPFSYIDQVVISESVRGTGLGRQLYDQIERIARTRLHRRLCCEVNTSPPNPHSLAFHYALGFNTLSTMTTQDGREVKLLEKSIR